MRAVKVWFPVIVSGSGTDVWTRRLGDALRRRGVDTEITWFPARYQFCPFLLRRTPAPRGTTLIHTNSWNAFAFKRKGIPLVVTEHQGVFDSKYRPYKNVGQKIYHLVVIRQYVMALFRAASAITAVSRFTALSLARTMDINTARVIPNCIDVTAFTPLEYCPRSDRRPFRLLFVGNLSPLKGANLLPRIMQRLGPDFILYFTYGLRRPHSIPVTQLMIPLGSVTEEDKLIKAYQECDALLFPSRFEGFGFVALEAMACGKPVITSNASAFPEVVEHGVTGILCPPDDVDAFVAACRRLADNPEILRAYGQAARRRAEELFSEERIIPQYIDLYENLIAQSR